MFYSDLIKVNLPKYLASTIGVYLFWLWGSLVKVTYVNSNYLQDIRAGNYSANCNFILSFWHDRFPFLIYLWRHKNGSVLASTSKDGEIITKVCQRLGYSVSRGSSSRDGLRGFLSMAREIKSGNIAGVTIDGPKGPRHIVKPGIIALAAISQTPILPVTYRADKQKLLHNWDKTVLPKVGSKCTVLYGEPVLIPPDAKHEPKLEEYRQILEHKMLQLEIEIHNII
jgi:lysophospholipid acyltransferase (LPLAT)-like uncharacterized protein